MKNLCHYLDGGPMAGKPPVPSIKFNAPPSERSQRDISEFASFMVENKVGLVSASALIKCRCTDGERVPAPIAKYNDDIIALFRLVGPGMNRLFVQGCGCERPNQISIRLVNGAIDHVALARPGGNPETGAKYPPGVVGAARAFVENASAIFIVGAEDVARAASDGLSKYAKELGLPEKPIIIFEQFGFTPVSPGQFHKQPKKINKLTHQNGKTQHSVQAK